MAPHTHRAELEGTVFTCLRRATESESGLVIAWEVYRNDVLLKGDCRTLNEAKKICRDNAAGGTP